MYLCIYRTELYVLREESVNYFRLSWLFMFGKSAPQEFLSAVIYNMQDVPRIWLKASASINLSGTGLCQKIRPEQMTVNINALSEQDKSARVRMWGKRRQLHPWPGWHLLCTAKQMQRVLQRVQRSEALTFITIVNKTTQDLRIFILF